MSDKSQNECFALSRLDTQNVAEYDIVDAFQLDNSLQQSAKVVLNYAIGIFQNV